MADEDTLKAVEALADLASELAMRAAAHDLEARAKRLRDGCRMLRLGRRGAPEAQEIISLSKPEEPREGA